MSLQVAADKLVRSNAFVRRNFKASPSTESTEASGCDAIAKDSGAAAEPSLADRVEYEEGGIELLTLPERKRTKYVREWLSEFVCYLPALNWLLFW